MIVSSSWLGLVLPGSAFLHEHTLVNKVVCDSASWAADTAMLTTELLLTFYYMSGRVCDSFQQLAGPCIAWSAFLHVAAL